MAAWDVLAKADSNLISSVDNWISSEDRLALGYGLARRVDKYHAEIRRVKASDVFLQAEQQLELTENIKNDSQSVYADVDDIKYTYTLFDLNNYMPISPSDVGVGISQIFPLVVAALSRNKGLIACEQPELHIHPRIQVAVGDLLTQIDKGANFLIETHSEHLILRLLRRIRETSYGENSQDKKLKPSDISVVYLNPSKEGVKVIHYEVTPDGDFTKDWPQGFFEERYEEQ